MGHRLTMGCVTDNKVRKKKRKGKKREKREKREKKKEKNKGIMDFLLFCLSGEAVF
jgi:hypothetical protein